MSNETTDSEEEEIHTNMNSINDLSTDSSENEIVLNNENDIETMKKLVDLCVKYENDLKKINSLKKTISDKLKKTQNALIPYMENKEIDHINLNTNLGGGKIKYNNTKVYGSLSKKKLTELINVYFKNDETTKKLIKFLYDNREYKYVKKIVKTKK